MIAHVAAFHPVSVPEGTPMSQQPASTVRYPSQPVGTAQPEPLHPTQDLVAYAKAYARQQPESVAFLCFGIGFILGWKLKPW